MQIFLSHFEQFGNLRGYFVVNADFGKLQQTDAEVLDTFGIVHFVCALVNGAGFDSAFAVVNRGSSFFSPVGFPVHAGRIDDKIFQRDCFGFGNVAAQGSEVSFQIGGINNNRIDLVFYLAEVFGNIAQNNRFAVECGVDGRRSRVQRKFRLVVGNVGALRRLNRRCRKQGHNRADDKSVGNPQPVFSLQKPVLDSLFCRFAVLPFHLQSPFVQIIT